MNPDDSTFATGDEVCIIVTTPIITSYDPATMMFVETEGEVSMETQDNAVEACCTFSDLPEDRIMNNGDPNFPDVFCAAA